MAKPLTSKQLDIKIGSLRKQVKVLEAKKTKAVAAAKKKVVKKKVVKKKAAKRKPAKKKATKKKKKR